jgi:pectate lyase
MKFSNLSISVLAGFAAAVPTPTIEQEASRAQIAKRAAINDVAFGFASLNGGTNGGAGGTTVTVTNYAQFTAAVSATPGAKKVVIVNGLITANAKQVNITSNTSVIGKNSGAKFLGVGLLVKNANNVIIRNIAVSKVIADNGDAIGIRTYPSE